MVQLLGRVDETLQQIATALEGFVEQHPDSHITLYRYNPGAVRVRIVSSRFQGVSRFERQKIVLDSIADMPMEIRGDISIMLCLAPGETSMMDVEFEEPVPTDM